MMTTPIEFWRAGFVFWTRAVEAQMELTNQWMAAWGLWEREAEKAAEAAVEAAQHGSMAPNAVSAPKPRPKPKAVSLKPEPTRPTAH